MKLFFFILLLGFSSQVFAQDNSILQEDRNKAFDLLGYTTEKTLITPSQFEDLDLNRESIQHVILSPGENPLLDLNKVAVVYYRLHGEPTYYLNPIIPEHVASRSIRR